MTLKLENADPDPPEAGKDFEFEATGGSANYTFAYKVGIDGGTVRLSPQESNKLKIKIPRGSADKQLWISVEEGNGDEDTCKRRLKSETPVLGKKAV